MRYSLSLVLIAAALLGPAAAFGQWSLDAGGAREIQYGTFLAPCGCTFQPSGGYGILGSARYEVSTLGNFALEAAAGFHYTNFTSYEYPNNRDSSDLARIGLTYLTAEPSVRYTIPHTHAFVRLGANLGFLLSNSYQHETHPVPDPEEDVDSSMGDLRTLRIAAALAAGYSIPLGSIEFVPTITVELPLNTIRDINANNWRVVSYIDSIGIRFTP